MKNPDKNTRKSDDDSTWSALALPGTIGVYIAGGALLGLAAGHFIDRWLNTAPIASLIGLLLGLAVGIYGVFRLVTSLK
ncbi:MAG TPA: AtpZ/AtpI family protein [Ktedonobacterales bacterium]|nr:AtpZ/AtpI family protein [Ktedonobacterales bacterium]